jgi:hypothetical protein
MFSWMTFFTGRIPVIFIMAIIIGIIAGNFGNLIAPS